MREFVIGLAIIGIVVIGFAITLAVEMGILRLIVEAFRR